MDLVCSPPVLCRGRSRGTAGRERGGLGAGRHLQRRLLQDEYVAAVSVGAGEHPGLDLE